MTYFLLAQQYAEESIPSHCGLPCVFRDLRSRAESFNWVRKLTFKLHSIFYTTLYSVSVIPKTPI
jgi:hypothetical protein